MPQSLHITSKWRPKFRFVLLAWREEIRVLCFSVTEFLCRSYFCSMSRSTSHNIIYIMMYFKSKLRLIVRVNVVLNRTVFIDSDLRFDNLCGSHLQSQKMTTVQVWRWLPHRLSKSQSMSTTTVLFRTTFTQTIKRNLLLKWLLGSNLSQWCIHYDFITCRNYPSAPLYS